MAPVRNADKLRVGAIGHKPGRFFVLGGGVMPGQAGGVIARRAGGVPQVRAELSKRWTLAKREKFLSVLAATANVRFAATSVGMGEPGAYRLRKRDPGFAKAWGEALCEGYTRLELLMLERAMVGVTGVAIEVIDGATAMKLSERTIMSLLTHHRQEVRSLREVRAAAREANPAPEVESDDEIRTRLIARLDEMHERLIAVADNE